VKTLSHLQIELLIRCDSVVDQILGKEVCNFSCVDPSIGITLHRH
jgi:hypothetical protein